MNPIDFTLIALTLWREARSEPTEGRRGVLHVILNRVNDKRWPSTAYGVCLQPLQFSCHNANDPNATKWPAASDKAWIEIQQLVASPGADPTGGANHYCTEGVAAKTKWADPAKMTRQIGAHRFYRL